MIEFILNDKLVIAVSPPTTVLLDFLRREQKLIGTKEGCREGDCGACAVLAGELKGNEIEYKNVNSCLLPIGSLHGKHIVTIEGLNSAGLTKIQHSIAEEGGTQCGFCTPGFIVSLSCYFLNESDLSLSGAINYLSGNICRCTGYSGIKRGVEQCIGILENAAAGKRKRLDNLIACNFIPSYFAGIPALLKKIKSHPPLPGKKGALVSGGTDLYVQKWEELVRANARFVPKEEKYKEIALKKGRIYIGAAAAIEQIKNSPILQKYFPEWNEFLTLFGSLPVRNRATAGGNVVNASPIGDFTSILIALDALVHIKGKKVKRQLPLKNLYKGYKITDLKKDEIVEAFSFKAPSRNLLFNYEKVSKRTFLDIASVNSSIAVEVKNNLIINVTISAGGVASVPLCLGGISSFLRGKEICAAIIKQGAAVAMEEISPISDARGSAEYKRLLLRQLLYAHFIKLFPEQINPEELL